MSKKEIVAPVYVSLCVAFVMAEGHLCIKCAVIFDAEVAFGHDKSDTQRDD